MWESQVISSLIFPLKNNNPFDYFAEEAPDLNSLATKVYNFLYINDRIKEPIKLMGTKIKNNHA